MYKKGTYEKFKNSDDPDANGVTMRLVKNGEEVQFYGGSIQGNISSNAKVKIDETLEVKAGDEIIFAVTAEGNNSYDGGKLSVRIGLPGEVTDPDPDPDPEPGRENSADLKDDFGEQGNNGWYYGFCDWDAQNFGTLSFTNNEYTGDNDLVLKADYVHPGTWQCAAYKWVAAEDGTINITGKYVKFANDSDSGANGVTVRIFRNEGDENVKKFMDEADDGQKINVNNITSERTVTINETFEVQKGDEIIFTVNAEGNSSYDGGRLSITIAPADDTSTYTLRKEDAENSDGMDIIGKPQEGTDLEENAEGGAGNSDGTDVTGKPEEGAVPGGNAGEDAEDKEDAADNDGTVVTGKPKDAEA